jgi:acyl-CoA synthetase (AMP-forming)/AMP-acid ligase II
VTVQDRSPDGVLKAIERHKADLLPTSPTFINLLLLSEAYKRHNLSSLKLVTYGTESMPESTLRRFNKLFPNIRLLQTYGLSEVGILRSKSKYSNTLWMKIGGEGYKTRVLDGVLQIKAQSAMLGYLNAPNPFTDDGWFDTGDCVQLNGEYLKIIGRKSDIINVGGKKVYPAEVENVIQELDGVLQVTVFGEKNALLGNIVCANVSLSAQEDGQRFKRRLKRYCKTKLDPFEIPVKINIKNEVQYTDRFKKLKDISF